AGEALPIGSQGPLRGPSPASQLPQISPPHWGVLLLALCAWVVDPGQVAAQPEAVERLHAALALQGVATARIQAAVGLHPGVLAVDLQVFHVLLLAIAGLECAGVL